MRLRRRANHAAAGAGQLCDGCFRQHSACSGPVATGIGDVPGGCTGNRPIGDGAAHPGLFAEAIETSQRVLRVDPYDDAASGAEESALIDKANSIGPGKKKHRFDGLAVDTPACEC